MVSIGADDVIRAHTSWVAEAMVEEGVAEGGMAAKVEVEEAVLGVRSLSSRCRKGKH